MCYNSGRGILIKVGVSRMINIAIVEDEKIYSDQIKEYLDKFHQRHPDEVVGFNITVSTNAVDFLERYKPSRCDLVFLDIMMPHIDGMRAAEKLREVDNSVLIIFITNMGDYAVRGYDVNATAFIKKPVSYADFEAKLKRAVGEIKKRDSRVIIIHSGTKEIKLLLRDLKYIEVYGHTCIFHMTTGENIESRNTLGTLYKKLKQYDFVKISNSYLINMQYIDLIKGNTLKIGNDELVISRLKKKEFMQRFNEWAASGGIK